MLLVGAFSRNLSYQAFSEMEIFMIIEYVFKYNEIHNKNEKEVKEATQSDFDKF
ncbi:hypothetical protein [Peptostreptococcus porci]|uniref:hypothetical protein n=1 Tax=Peptostreptococcus porci TaxID=2652282 RepID=UPI002A81030E|nr:hypothetical protein [Peptostreptococcus porci]